MRENLKVLDTKLNKEICLMALVKNQRYSKNSKNNIKYLKNKIVYRVALWKKIIILVLFIALKI